MATRVWDIGIRAFHWLLVASIVTLLLTGFFAPKNWIDGHVAVGTFVLVLIVCRVVWGFLGSHYARFASFVVSPSTAVRYAIDLSRGGADHHIGHNPLGAMMILALLATVAMSCLTGLLALAGLYKDGPLAAISTYAIGDLAKEFHRALAFLLLAAIAAHVAGVAVETWRTGENLVAAMLTGRKRSAARHRASRQLRSRPGAAVAVITASLAVSALAWNWALALPATGRPTPVDPAYAKECSPCHTAHHPTLAPAATWREIFAGLSDHFGDNAELEPAQAAALAAYAIGNSAETADTHAARRLRAANGSEPLRITATPGWRRLHEGVSQASFALKKVGGKANCGACHGDAASGLFHPRAISIPKE